MGGLNKKGNRRLSSKIFTPPFRYPPKSDRGAFLAFSEEGLAFDKRVKESERLVVVAYLKSSSTTLSGKQDWFDYRPKVFFSANSDSGLNWWKSEPLFEGSFGLNMRPPLSRTANTKRTDFTAECLQRVAPKKASKAWKSLTDRFFLFRISQELKRPSKKGNIL